jgi:hypothetical protein
VKLSLVALEESSPAICYLSRAYIVLARQVLLTTRMLQVVFNRLHPDAVPHSLLDVVPIVPELDCQSIPSTP